MRKRVGLSHLVQGSRAGALLAAICSGLALGATSFAAAPAKPAAGPVVQFRTDRAGNVSLNLYRADGSIVRRLVSEKSYAAGAQKIVWDGMDDNGDPAPPGEYTWKGIYHEGIRLQLRGWAGNGGTTPWPTADGKGGWGGDIGEPTAVAADAQRVYLGWSMAEQGKSILACDLEGRVQWGHRRDEGPSGCQALAVDGGVLYVLGGLEGPDADGGAIYRLNAKDGKPMPWPNGKLDLRIAELWPAEANTKPIKADSMAVRHGHIYLSFTSSEFMTVLDAKTGDYLQTIVGAAPGQVDVAPTKTDLPDAPGKLVDADFAVISLGGGVLGKVLMAHDPLWVITSELSRTERNGLVTALSVIGDSGKIHRHTAFVGMGEPLHQVQARPLLDTESFTWVAGKPGGRPATGPWQTDAMRNVMGVALDAAGKLWVAEGDAFPKRFSVWDTSGNQGKLVKEFFGPAGEKEIAGAINPLDPNLMFGQGCEWRIDPKTGWATCLGTVIRKPVRSARYAVGENGNVYLLAEVESGLDILERVGDGDYKLRASLYSSKFDRVTGEAVEKVKTFAWADENGDGQLQEEEQKSSDEVIQFGASAALQDLTLSATTDDNAALGRIFKVQGWSPCGAPRYDLAHPVDWPRQAWLSADQHAAMGLEDAAGIPGTAKLKYRNAPDGRELWSMLVSPECALRAGSALLPAPLGNVWMMDLPTRTQSVKGGKDQVVLGGGCALINEDGFFLGSFFARTEARTPWPKEAAPGADMTKVECQSSGRLTQAADGKLYLQTGDQAYWNLEITGLDKVRALPGGTVVIAPAK